MKKSVIEKQLKKELESNRSSFSEIWERCEGVTIPKQELALQTVDGENPSYRKQDLRKPLALFLSAILLFAFSILSFIGGEDLLGGKLGKFSDGYFIIDINPSIEVGYDEKGIVTSAKGLNEDGKALLVGVALIGRRYDEAAEILCNRCVALGYFSLQREDNALLATAVAENGEKDEAMTKALKKAVLQEFVEKQMHGVVITGISSPTLTQEGSKYGIDGQKYGLILTYLELGGTLDEKEYATVSIRELYARIESLESQLKAERSQESLIVLENFEKKLMETISEQIGILLETLGAVLPIAEEEINRFGKLEEYVAALEEVKTQKQRKQIIDNILTELDSLKEGEPHFNHIMLIESAKMVISAMYGFFEAALYKAVKIGATPEMICTARLEKFEQYIGKDVAYEDTKTWQKEKEKEISDGWYELKVAWRADRGKDL